MENVYFFVLKSLHREHTPFQAAKRNIVLIVITPLICVMTVPFLKYCYKSILHCSVHRVTVGILSYIVLPFGSIFTI